jgi:hypothetical protein
MLSQIVINIEERDFLDMSHGLNSLYRASGDPVFDFYRAAIMKLILDHFSDLKVSVMDLMRPFIPLQSTGDSFSLHLPFTDEEMEAVKNKTGIEISSVSPCALGSALLAAFEKSTLLRIGVGELFFEHTLREGRLLLRLSQEWGCYMAVQLLDEDTDHWMPCPPKPFLGRHPRIND